MNIISTIISNNSIILYQAATGLFTTFSVFLFHPPLSGWRPPSLRYVFSYRLVGPLNIFSANISKSSSWLIEVSKIHLLFYFWQISFTPPLLQCMRPKQATCASFREAWTNFWAAKLAFELASKQPNLALWLPEPFSKRPATAFRFASPAIRWALSSPKPVSEWL